MEMFTSRRHGQGSRKMLLDNYDEILEGKVEGLQQWRCSLLGAVVGAAERCFYK